MPPKKPEHENIANYGVHYGKTDLERFGLFAEMTYMHGMGYNFPKLYGTTRDEKGRQMFPGGHKEKVGLQDCYFDHEFKRIFEGEALSSLYKQDRKNRAEAAAAFLTTYGFTPQKFPQASSTPGDFYGTFGGRIDAMSPKEKLKEKSDFKKSLIVKPGKKGGPGYVDITIGKYPEHFSSKAIAEADKKTAVISTQAFRSGWPPRYFDPYPNHSPGEKQEKTYMTTREPRWQKYGTFVPPSKGKRLGGMKGGGFSKFPEYIDNKYIDPWKIEKYGPTGLHDNKDKGYLPFYPPVRNKTLAISSPMQRNIDFKTNVMNYRKKKPSTYTREFGGF